MRVVKENVYRLLFQCAEMSFELKRHPELKKKVIIADIYIYIEYAHGSLNSV